MSTGARRALVVAGLAGLGLLAVWAVTGLPDFGHPIGRYGVLAPQVALAKRHVTDAVGGVTFDLRGLDTLGEELILFCAAVGATVLLRAERPGEEEATEESQRVPPRPAGALRALGAGLGGPLLVLGAYVVVHGHLTPGGGFQGGVILAAAVLLVYAAGQLIGLEHVRATTLVELAEAIGAAAFVIVAVGGLVFATAAMANFLPFGTSGSLLSGGTIPVLNIAVGVEVAAGITLILTELLGRALFDDREEDS